ncbi:MAG: hypothetical protein CW691_10165 [Candidatus Bathyarchaeum sp.]|nr:MAG: hypothetical protein CW691_10165 [Candidatus Bathyarchaeum sp.]
MPIKMLRNENDDELVIEMVLHAKNYSMTLSKKKCTGCGICMEICPTEAIQVLRTPKKGEKAKKPTVSINEQKCHYCGMCEALCPFGALDLRVDGKPVVPVVRTESFPQLVRNIKVDESKCGVECLEIEDACPLDNIKVKGDKKAAKVSIEVDEASCPCCRFCETKFPAGAVRVEKTFYGNLKINSEKCPEGCHDCVDVCPISDVLYVQDGKVQVNDTHCVYCGACKIACPEEDALELSRTQVRHTEVRSGAWNRALEKLASRSAVVKESRVKSADKLKKIVTNRLAPEELD